MPAPQVSVVHRHCSSWKSWAFTGTWQAWMVGASLTVVGKARAPSRNLASSCSVDRLWFLESISAAMPETMGAEKLVPRLLSIWLVKECVAGTVAPSFDVVSSENRQGP